MRRASSRRGVERRAPFGIFVAVWLVVSACGTAPSGESRQEQSSWTWSTAPIVYTSRVSGNSDLWLVSAPGQPGTILTADEAEDHWASPFPNGDRIAFQSMRDGQREIWTITHDGQAPVNLSSHPAQDLLPEVSPDGRWIAFFSDRGIDHGPRELPGHLYRMRVDGSSLERLTEEPLSSTFVGTWSPDGNSVLLARDFGGDIDLVRLDLASRREERILGTPAAEYGGRDSPDGGRIAFHAAGAAGESRIVVMNADGGQRRELTRGGQHYDPHWSPDGSWLLFTGAPLGSTQFDLLAVPVDGGDVETLVATEADERSGAWLPVR